MFWRGGGGEGEGRGRGGKGDKQGLDGLVGKTVLFAPEGPGLEPPWPHEAAHSVSLQLSAQTCLCSKDSAALHARQA